MTRTASAHCRHTHENTWWLAREEVQNKESPHESTFAIYQLLPPSHAPSKSISCRCATCNKVSPSYAGTVVRVIPSGCKNVTETMVPDVGPPPCHRLASSPPQGGPRISVVLHWTNVDSCPIDGKDLTRSKRDIFLLLQIANGRDDDDDTSNLACFGTTHPLISCFVVVGIGSR
jgi:hypothetical protein